MRFRLGLATGFATGYYLGARAGRQRYDQINRSVARLRRSEAFEEATERARTVVEEGVEKARSLVDTRADNGQGSDPIDTDTPPPVVPGAAASADDPGEINAASQPEPPAGPGDYSSSR